MQTNRVENPQAEASVPHEVAVDTDEPRTRRPGMSQHDCVPGTIRGVAQPPFTAGLVGVRLVSALERQLLIHDGTMAAPQASDLEFGLLERRRLAMIGSGIGYSSLAAETARERRRFHGGCVRSRRTAAARSGRIGRRGQLRRSQRVPTSQTERCGSGTSLRAGSALQRGTARSNERHDGGREKRNRDPGVQSPTQRGSRAPRRRRRRGPRTAATGAMLASDAGPRPSRPRALRRPSSGARPPRQNRRRGHRRRGPYACRRARPGTADPPRSSR